MRVVLRIKRFNPEAVKPKPYDQDYELDVEEWFTVLDALVHIREEIDGTLDLRCSCRASICGSCGMRVNGEAKLVCKTRLTNVSKNDGPITIEPMGNMQVITDLVTDTSTFWDKVRQIDPYIQPTGPEPEAEYVASNEDMVHLAGVMNCIMCGCCVSDCAALEVDDSFIGPAALAKAYRFVADPRDGKTDARLEDLNDDSGIWDCTRCMKCVEVCPKDVDPMGRIMAMRERAMGAGYENTPGARHTKSFAASIKRSGRLNETRLAVESIGYKNITGQLAMVPLGLKVLQKGKLPPILGHKIPSQKAVNELFNKIEEKE